MVEYNSDKIWGEIKAWILPLLGEAHFQSGKTKNAESLFMEAEKMQKKSQPQYPYFYSLPGYQYCDLLISSGRYEEALKRAETTIKIAERSDWLLDIALDNLTIGRALMIKLLQSPSTEFILKNEGLRTGFSKAEKFLNLAVDGLRESGTQNNLPWGLLARAALYRHKENFSKAWTDLYEAREIAEYGEMKLHLVDYYLEGAKCMEKQLTVDGEQLIETLRQAQSDKGQKTDDSGQIKKNRRQTKGK